MQCSQSMSSTKQAAVRCIRQITSTSPADQPVRCKRDQLAYLPHHSRRSLTHSRKNVVIGGVPLVDGEEKKMIPLPPS